MKKNTESSTVSLLVNDGGYDSIEDRLRASVRAMIETVFEEELAPFLGRLRYGLRTRTFTCPEHAAREFPLSIRDTTSLVDRLEVVIAVWAPPLSGSQMLKVRGWRMLSQPLEPIAP